MKSQTSKTALSTSGYLRHATAVENVTFQNYFHLLSSSLPKNFINLKCIDRVVWLGKLNNLYQVTIAYSILSA